MSVGVLAAAVAAALAVSPLGDGRDGDLRVDQGVVIVNRATALLAPAAAGSTALALDPLGFTAGDLALVLQTTETATPDAGALADIATSQVGRHEWVRVDSVTGDGLRLTVPLAQEFLEGSQVVFVPQFRSVVIADAGVLSANPWDGRAGGVLAFVVAGPLRNDGVVSATGLGFRGGAWTDTHASCGALAEHSWGPPGEGVWGLFLPPTGRRPSGTGGSGGWCTQAGAIVLGGGGGNAGRGGTVPGNVTGGLALRVGPERLVLGGGGGAGLCSGTERAGGRGGGGVWVRARTVDGQGRFEADGARALGSGGGGGGGTVDVRTVGALGCAEASAAGAQARILSTGGGTCGGSGSPGGGGRVALQGASVSCAARASAGLPGGADSTPQDPEDPDYRGTVDVTRRPLELDEAPLGSGLDGGAGGSARHLQVGCGCRAAGAPVSPLAMLSCVGALAVAARRWRRRRRQASSTPVTPA